MNKPLFIKVHGYLSGKTFTINANLIERIQQSTDKKPHTKLYMCGMFYQYDDGNSKPNYQVKETEAEIYELIQKVSLLEP